MDEAEAKGRWLDLGERIRDNPADLEAWNEILAIGRLVYIPGTGRAAGHFAAVLDL